MFVDDDKLDRETNLLLPPTCYFRSMSREAAARPFRLTQARIGDTLHDGDGTRVAIVNAFTTVNPETEATVRAVDYQVVGAGAEEFRMYSDDGTTSPAGGASRHRVRRLREGWCAGFYTGPPDRPSLRP